MEKETLTTARNNAKIKTDKRKEKESLAITLLTKLNAEQLENFIKECSYGQQRAGFKP